MEPAWKRGLREVSASGLQVGKSHESETVAIRRFVVGAQHSRSCDEAQGDAIGSKIGSLSI